MTAHFRGAAAALPLLLLLALACRTAAPNSAASGAGADTLTIRRDIAYLASDALEGRGTGTAGNDSAAAYIARRYAALGLVAPAFPCDAAPASRCAPYLQPFVARAVAAAHAGLPAALPTQNVVAMVAGADPALRNEYVVIGAHFDHLGRNAFGAMDPEARDAIRNGADDNASGTVAVMELARLFKARPPRRSLVFVNFSGEELGLLGSEWFAAHPNVPRDHIVAMLNFDMVGRLKNDRLLVYGVATATELPSIVEAANVAPGFDLKAIGDGFGPSDQSSFYARDIPVLHFFTDLHEDYHRATDRANRIDVAGEARVIDFAARIARTIANAPSRLTFVRAPERQVAQADPSASPGAVTSGYGAYLGSIPDMGAGDVKGVRLTGVRAGSPADNAGIEAGDIVVEMAGKPIGDLYEYTDALRAHKAGDTVEIVVLRAGQRLTLAATLGTRGS